MRGAGAPVALVRSVDVVPTIAQARHEAGHATVAAALGARPSLITLHPQPIAFFDDEAITLPGRVAIRLAGEVAEQWGNRWVVEPSDGVVGDFLARVDRRVGGCCDGCRAVELMRQIAPEADATGIAQMVRDISRAVYRIIKQPEVWRAVEELARLCLKQNGALDYQIQEIIERHFEPGSFQLEVSHPALVAAMQQKEDQN
jgi:hypothetical protein